MEMTRFCCYHPIAIQLCWHIIRLASDLLKLQHSASDLDPGLLDTP